MVQNNTRVHIYLIRPRCHVEALLHPLSSESSGLVPSPTAGDVAVGDAAPEILPPQPHCLLLRLGLSVEKGMSSPSLMAWLRRPMETKTMNGSDHQHNCMNKKRVSNA